MQKQEPTCQEISVRQSKYTKQLNAYTRTEFPNIIPLLMVISKECKYGSKYPVYKVLKVIAKQFLLNEIEGIFFTYLIQQTEWSIRQKLLYMNAENVRDIVSCSIEATEYKCLILYLMVTAYTVKFYLNDDHGEFLEDANKICPNFRMIFESWAKKHSNITSKINLKMLNRVYKELYTCLRQNSIDFNMMVDSIIQISPAYSSEREKKEKDPKDSRVNSQNFHQNIIHGPIPGKRNHSIPMINPGKRIHQNGRENLVRQSDYSQVLPIVQEHPEEGFFSLNPLTNLKLKKYDSSYGGNSLPSVVIGGGEDILDTQLFGDKVQSRQKIQDVNMN